MRGPKVNRHYVRYAGIALICLLASVGSGSVSAAGQNTAPNLANLSAFKRRVLLPTSDLVPAHHLVLDQSSGSADTYQVRYRDSNGTLAVQGSGGRTVFDAAVQRDTQGCSATNYCSSGARPGGGASTEVFRNLKVRGNPAILEHSSGTAGPGWTLLWYDSSSDTTYSLGLSESLGGSFAAGGTDPTNVSVGHDIAGLAEKLGA
jgi:hypothetical protein